MTLFPEWFQPFENIDFISVKVELQQIWSGFGGDKNSENMLVFKLDSTTDFFSSTVQTHPWMGQLINYHNQIFCLLMC